MQEILSFLEGKHTLKVSTHLQDRKDSSQSSIKPVTKPARNGTLILMLKFQAKKAMW